MKRKGEIRVTAQSDAVRCGVSVCARDSLLWFESLSVLCVCVYVCVCVVVCCFWVGPNYPSGVQLLKSFIEATTAAKVRDTASSINPSLFSFSLSLSLSLSLNP